jgi:hypothetical protein
MVDEVGLADPPPPAHHDQLRRLFGGEGKAIPLDLPIYHILQNTTSTTTW